MKPLILLTAGYEISQNGQNRRYIYQSYADAITRAGGIPLLTLDDGELSEETTALAHGLLLTGGPDIDPALYGEEKLPECGAVDTQRDAMEYTLLDRFVKSRRPVFGICRGMQIINCYFGGSLWQDIPTQLGAQHSAADKPHECVHEIAVAPGSFLHRAYGEAMTVNSYHHQSVKKMAEGFVTAAVCGEVTEAMAHTSLPIWAVQWHPERMTGSNRFVGHGPDSAPLFSDFVRQCMSV